MNELGIEQELVILTKGTIDKFLEYDNASDLISLYTFYYYTAKWQKTNQPKAVDKYVMAGLHMGKVTFSKAKKILEELGLIEQVINRKANGKVEGYYIKLKFIFKQETAKENSQWYQKQLVDETASEFQETNALSTNNLNALSENKLNTLTRVKEKSLEEKNKQQLTNAVLSEFIKVNPSIKGMMGWKHVRESAWSLIEIYGLEKVVEIVRGLPHLKDCVDDPRYIPYGLSPTKLLENWTKIETLLYSKSSKERKPYFL